MSDSQIRALHAEFRAGLPLRLARIRALTDELRAGSRVEALEELRTAAHRLRGVCGSFEMHELEEPSRVIEMECKKTPDLAVIDTAIADLARLIASATPVPQG